MDCDQRHARDFSCWCLPLIHLALYLQNAEVSPEHVLHRAWWLAAVGPPSPPRIANYASQRWVCWGAVDRQQTSLSRTSNSTSETVTVKNQSSLKLMAPVAVYPFSSSLQSSSDIPSFLCRTSALVHQSFHLNFFLRPFATLKLSLNGWIYIN